MKQKIVLAYSGGLDTSVSIKWLQEKFHADVVTLTLNLGQLEDFREIEERAYSTGAVKHFQMDARDEFVTGYVHPSIKANGMYQGKYPLATALGRPLIATKLVEVAESEGAYAVAHGCTGKGNDQVRMDVTVRSLNPGIKVIAPVREWNMTRDMEIDYAKEHGIHIKPKKSVFSIDQNLSGKVDRERAPRGPRDRAASRSLRMGLHRRRGAGRAGLPRAWLRPGDTRLPQRAGAGQD